MVASSEASSSSAAASKEADLIAFTAAVKDHLLFNHLDKPSMKFVHTNSRLHNYRGGAKIYEAGSTPEHFYVVQSGSFRESEKHSTGGSERARRLHEEGCTFGSHELIFPKARITTVAAAEGGGVVWSIPKRVFESKLRVAPSPSKALLKFMRRCPLFFNLRNEELLQLARAAKELKLREGVTVCNRGDSARCVYAVRHGIVEAVHSSFAQPLQMRPPMCFGESALYSDEGMRRRQATVSVVRDASQYQESNVSGDHQRFNDMLEWKGSVLVSFDANDIESLLGFGLQGSAEHAFHRKLLEAVRIGGRPIAQGLDSDLVDWLVDTLEEHVYEDGEMVVKEGRDAEKVFIVKRGEAAITTVAGGKIATISTGNFFGELALLQKKSQRGATVTAMGPSSLVLLCLEADVVKRETRLDAWRNELELTVDEMKRSHEKENKAKAAAQYEADLKSGKITAARAKKQAKMAAKADKEGHEAGTPRATPREASSSPSASRAAAKSGTTTSGTDGPRKGLVRRLSESLGLVSDADASVLAEAAGASPGGSPATGRAPAGRRSSLVVMGDAIASLVGGKDTKKGSTHGKKRDIKVEV